MIIRSCPRENKNKRYIETLDGTTRTSIPEMLAMGRQLSLPASVAWQRLMRRNSCNAHFPSKSESGGR
ncbi:MAG: hypothetical protein LBQ43_00445 [Holosporales bacterium]|nr:hypothetical protein [Holosporales bacterium]